jgi:hypothetical protein
LAARLRIESERDLRRGVIWPLRSRFRVPVVSKPGPRGGYKLRATAEEFRDAVDWTDRMGRDFFQIRTVLRHESVEVVMGQMVMEFLGGPGVRATRREDALTMLIDDEGRRGRKVAWTDVVEHLLRVMAERPEEYAEPLARIRARHGGMFLDEARRAELEGLLERGRALLRAGSAS